MEETPGRSVIAQRLVQLMATQVGVVAALFALHFLLLTGLRSLRSKDFGLWNAVVRGGIDAELVVAGSSNALVEFDCRAIQASTGLRCFNIALDGSVLVQHFPMLDVYLRHNKPPRVVVQALNEGVLTRPAKIYRPTSLIPYLDHEVLYRQMLRIEPSFWRYRYVPLYAFSEFGPTVTNDALRGLLGAEPGGEERVLGYLPKDREWNGDFEAFVALYPQGTAFQVSAEALDALRKVAEMARARDALLVLVFTPEHKSLQRYVRNRAEIFDRLREAARELGAPFLDYSDLYWVADRRFFYNAEHLNRRGAELFSATFAADLNRLLDRRVGDPQNWK